MNIKKTNYGCHVIHGHDTDICITSKDIQMFYDRGILTILSNGKAVVSIHDVELKTITSDYTVEVVR